MVATGMTKLSQNGRPKNRFSDYYKELFKTIETEVMSREGRILIKVSCMWNDEGMFLISFHPETVTV